MRGSSSLPLSSLLRSRSPLVFILWNIMISKKTKQKKTMISNPVQMIRDDDNNDDEKIRANSPTPRPVSRWGWMDPLCPAQNQSQSPVGDAHDEKW